MLTMGAIKTGIEVLKMQHLKLMAIVDDQLIVTDEEHQELQQVYSRLFLVMTLFEDHLLQLNSRENLDSQRTFSEIEKLSPHRLSRDSLQLNPHRQSLDNSHTIKSHPRLDGLLHAEAVPYSKHSLSHSLPTLQDNSKDDLSSTYLVPKFEDLFHKMKTKEPMETTPMRRPSKELVQFLSPEFMEFLKS